MNSSHIQCDWSGVSGSVKDAWLSEDVVQTGGRQYRGVKGDFIKDRMTIKGLYVCVCEYRLAPQCTLEISLLCFQAFIIYVK